MRYQKNSWFSRWQTIIILYDSLQLVLTYCRDTPIGINDGNVEYVYPKLQSLKYIYRLYFLINKLYFVINIVSNLLMQICVCQNCWLCCSKKLA